MPLTTKPLFKRPEISEQMVRVLRDDGSICWQVGNFVENAEVFPLDILFYDIFKKHALKMRPLGKPIFEPTGREKTSQIPVEWQKEMVTVRENC